MTKDLLRLAMGMDEVIADSHSYLLNCYARMFGYCWTASQ